MQPGPVNTSAANDSVIYIDLNKNVTTKTVSEKLNGINHPVKIIISITSGDSLIVSLHPADPNANIRINQIIMPDERADGPFGKTLQYPIKKFGTYTVVISNNLMVEGKIAKRNQR